MAIDNIIIGDLIEGITPQMLGVLDSEQTVTISKEEAENMNWFLPRILVHVGLFKSTSEIKKINDQRMKSNKIKDPLSRELWRTLEKPEMTDFKIGKKFFWLIVGTK